MLQNSNVQHTQPEDLCFLIYVLVCALILFLCICIHIFILYFYLHVSISTGLVTDAQTGEPFKFPWNRRPIQTFPLWSVSASAT